MLSHDRGEIFTSFPCSAQDPSLLVNSHDKGTYQGPVSYLYFTVSGSVNT